MHFVLRRPRHHCHARSLPPHEFVFCRCRPDSPAGIQQQRRPPLTPRRSLHPSKRSRPTGAPWQAAGRRVRFPPSEKHPARQHEQPARCNSNTRRGNPLCSTDYPLTLVANRTCLTGQSIHGESHGIRVRARGQPLAARLSCLICQDALIPFRYIGDSATQDPVHRWFTIKKLRLASNDLREPLRQENTQQF